MRDTFKALKWISEVLTKKKIRFQIMGGLAAKAYGSKRPLADIDIYIPNSYFKRLMPLIKPHIIHNLFFYRDENWKVWVVIIMYAGQRIEILGGDNVKIFDIKNERWVKPKVDYAESKKIKIYGITLPIMKKEYLIKYKKILGRGVDKQDINEIE